MKLVKSKHIDEMIATVDALLAERREREELKLDRDAFAQDLDTRNRQIKVMAAVIDRIEAEKAEAIRDAHRMSLVRDRVNAECHSLTGQRDTLVALLASTEDTLAANEQALKVAESEASAERANHCKTTERLNEASRLLQNLTKSHACLRHKYEHLQNVHVDAIENTRASAHELEQLRATVRHVTETLGKLA